MNEKKYYHHYILLREDNSIIDAWSDGLYPDKDVSNAICINDKGGYQFRFYDGGEENPYLYDMNWIPLYKWDGSKIISRSESEIEKEYSVIPPPPPSEMEQLRADVDFLLVMGGLT